MYGDFESEATWTKTISNDCLQTDGRKMELKPKKKKKNWWNTFKSRAIWFNGYWSGGIVMFLVRSLFRRMLMHALAHHGDREILHIFMTVDSRAHFEKAEKQKIKTTTAIEQERQRGKQHYSQGPLALVDVLCKRVKGPLDKTKYNHNNQTVWSLWIWHGKTPFRF